MACKAQKRLLVAVSGNAFSVKNTPRPQKVPGQKLTLSRRYTMAPKACHGEVIVALAFEISRIFSSFSEVISADSSLQKFSGVLPDSPPLSGS